MPPVSVNFAAARSLPENSIGCFRRSNRTRATQVRQESSLQFGDHRPFSISHLTFFLGHSTVAGQEPDPKRTCQTRPLLSLGRATSGEPNGQMKTIKCQMENDPFV